MTISHQDLDGNITVIDFSITFGTANLSADKQKIVINYTGFAYPELNAVSIDTYEYSLDNGSTWSEMTPSESTQLTGLSFTESGEENTFEWMAKEDVGVDFYNKTLRIRFNAVSGSDETGLTYTSYYFARETTNTAKDAADRLPFPENYAGISGRQLIQDLAPKL